MAIPDVDDRVNAALDKFDAAAQIVHDVANGPADATVPSESGPIPTLLKWQADHAAELGNLPAIISRLVTLEQISKGELTPQMFGAVGNGVADDTAALVAFGASTAGRNKRIPAGTYKTTAQVLLNPGDILYGDGPDSIIDASGNAAWSDPAVVRAQGTLVPLAGALAADVARGDDNFTLTNAAGVQAGDALIIFNPTDYSWAQWRPEYRAGEMVRVHSVSGSNVKLMGLLYDSYTAASVSIYRISGKSTTMRDFCVKTPAREGVIGHSFSLIDRPVLVDCWSTGSLYCAFEIERCMDMRVDTRGFQTQAPTNDEYALTIANCHGGTIDGVFNAGRHGIALGGYPFVGSVSNRAITIRASGLGNNAPIGAQDMHGNNEDITFLGGTFNAGVIGGKNNKYVGVTFRSKQNGGISMYMGEAVGGDHVFDDCEFESFTDPNLSSFGCINFSNLSANLTLACRFIFRGCRYKFPSASYGVRINLNGTPASHKFIFDGVDLTAPNLTGAFVRLSRSSGSATIDDVVVRDVTGLNASAAYVTNAGSGLTVNRYQLPDQHGVASIAAVVGQISAFLNVAYPHPYPIAPLLLPGKNGNAAGGKTTIMNASSITETGFIASVVTADGANFTTTQAGLVPWIAKLNQH